MKTLFYWVIMLVFLSCHSRRPELRPFTTQEFGIHTDSAFPGSCPYLFKGKDGTVVLSWLRDISDTVAVLCYVVSKNGADFSSAIVVPGSDNAHPHGENLPRVAVTPDGKILAAWGASNPNPGNPYSGIVYYSWSFDNGKKWTTPKTLSRDTNSIDQRYFDIEILKDSSVGVIWLDSRKDTNKEGSSLYFATFDSNYELLNERPVDIACCQCCRTDLFVDQQGNLHTVYRKIFNDSIRDMVHAVSYDNGKSFSDPGRISPDNWVITGCPHTGPAIAQTPKGLSFVWYTLGKGSGIFYSDSKDNGKSFTPKDQVSPKTSAKHPQLEVTRSGEQLIVWDENTSKGSWIGLEVRSQDGKKIVTSYLTDSSSRASFPVVKSFGDRFVVAFSGRKKSEDDEQVYYKFIDPE